MPSHGEGPEVRAALERDGWIMVRQVGSHRFYRKGGRTGLFAFHDREDLGGPMMARVAREFGYGLDEFGRMV